MLKYIHNLARGKYSGIIALPIKAILLALSLIYGLVIRFLILIYRIKPCRLNCKVISVGNITLGGTGKTSLVELICFYLKERGKKVAVLTRGYKGRPEAAADEPYMLQQKLKDVLVIVDADRIKAGKRAITDFGMDTLVLDDGFQQWRLHKDLEIVTIDATNPFGNKHMIPRGILREPIRSLKRADIFVLTKTNLTGEAKTLKDFLGSINPAAEVFESIHRPIGLYNIDNPKDLLNPESFKGKAVALFCGIGDPDSFEKVIAKLGSRIGLVLKFPDHHDYTQEDLQDIIRRSQESNIDTIITTEKDASRLRSFKLLRLGLKLFVLRIVIEIKGEQGFYDRLLKLYSV